MIKAISESQNSVFHRLFNDVIMDAIAINPTPTDKGKHLKIFYATQVCDQAADICGLCDEEELMHFSYMRFLENQIRKAFVFEGTSIHLIARKIKNRNLHSQLSTSISRLVFQLLVGPFFKIQSYSTNNCLD